MMGEGMTELAAAQAEPAPRRRSSGSLGEITELSRPPINDLVFSPWGLLLATDTEVVRIISPTQTETFYPYGAYRVWVDGKEVYLLDSECNLLYMEDGAAYLQ